MPVSEGYDLRAIAPTAAQILNAPAPSGAEVGPIVEIIETLPSAERLALVVIDGFGSALWKHAADAIPTLNRLADLHHLDIASVLPSVTYVCLSTILTGVSPGRHGVSTLSDAIRASDAAQIQTLFDTVRSTGGKTLLAAHRNGVEGLPLDRFADRTVVAEEKEDAVLYRQVPDLIRAIEPAFAFVHLIDIDEAAHDFGPYSDGMVRAARETDRRLRELLTRLAQSRYALILLADHGMHEVPGGVPDAEGHLGMHDGSVEEDLRVPLLWASPEEMEAIGLI